MQRCVSYVSEHLLVMSPGHTTSPAMTKDRGFNSLKNLIAFPASL